MEIKVLTPQTIWQNYDPIRDDLQYEEITQTYLDEINNIKSLFTAVDENGGRARIRLNQYFTNAETDTCIIVLPDYEKAVSIDLITRLAEKNILVLCPDIYGRSQETEYFGNIDYGKIIFAGEHIKQVCPSAKETNQFLYSKVIRRLITLAKKEFMMKKIILLGIEDGVEVAMQVAGVDERVNAICCLNGGGYKEYINFNKYGSSKQLDMDEKMMAWLTGVASVAYAKSIKCPFLLLAGSNSSKIDIDRIVNLFALLECPSYLDISPRAKDFCDGMSYNTLMNFIEDISTEKKFKLKIPEMYIRVNDDGKLYLNALIDSSFKIKNVKFYYSYDEINHLYRNWNKEKAIFLTECEYIANIGVNIKNCPFFAFVRVEYENGMALTSVMEYLDITGHEIKCEKDTNLRIIYNASKKYGNFSEKSDEEFLYDNTISLKENKLGLCGINSGIGFLRTYAIGQTTKSNIYQSIQIDINTNVEKEVSIILTKSNVAEINYKVTFKASPYDDLFKDYHFEAKDFKDSKMMPLENFSDIKVISILGNVVISNLLFI